jgi:hypothetical protein
MNNYEKIQKAKVELIYYSAKLNTYEGDVNKHKVIKELDKIVEILN